MRAKAGVYLNRDTGRVMRLVEKDGKLQRVDDGGSAQPLFAVSENRFSFAPASPFAFEFSGTGDQRVITTKSGDEKAATFKPVPEFTPSAAELNDYLGLFASEELDARYRVQLTDGKLHVATLTRNPIPLLPVTQDVFTNDDLGAVMFVRDAGGRISGFSVSSSRARNNEFAEAPVVGNSPCSGRAAPGHGRISYAAPCWQYKNTSPCLFMGASRVAPPMVLGRKITRLGVLIGALCMHAWAVAATDEYSVISAKEKVGSLIANVDG